VLAVFLPERLVFPDPADGLALLPEPRLVGGSVRFLGFDLTLEDALEGLVGRLGERQHLLARPLDVLARVMPREVGKTVDRLLSGAAEAGEDLAGELRAVRSDLGDLADQTGGFPRGIEDAVLRGSSTWPFSVDFLWRRSTCPCSSRISISRS